MSSAGYGTKQELLFDPFKDGSGKALYRLEDNALDESGNYNGTATSVTYGAGQFGRCGIPSATSGRITSSYNGNLYASSWTVNFWHKWDGLGGAIATPVSSGDLNIIFEPTAMQFYLCNGSTTIVKATVADATNDNTNLLKLKDNTWHMVTVAHTAGSANLTYYVDATIGANIDGGGGSTPISTNTHLFNRYTLNRASTTANMDQVRFFNRVLTAGEVSTLYTSENSVI